MDREYIYEERGDRREENVILMITRLTKLAIAYTVYRIYMSHM